MSTPHDVARRDRILDAATVAFAKWGFRAASMRDIAQDADCSLSLLTHHFGSTRAMLKAVVEHQVHFCEKRLVGLKSLLDPRATFNLDEFIKAWAEYEFDLSATRTGRNYLTLMLRLQADREVDQDVRSSLNCAESTIRKGFQRAWPSLDELAIRDVWQMTSSALYAAVVDSEDGMEQKVTPPETARCRVVSFLLHGLRGYCDWPLDEHAGASRAPE